MNEVRTSRKVLRKKIRACETGFTIFRPFRKEEIHNNMNFIFDVVLTKCVGWESISFCHKFHADFKDVLGTVS